MQVYMARKQEGHAWYQSPSRPHASHCSPVCRSPGSPAWDLSSPKEALQLGGEQPSGAHRPLLADLLGPPRIHPHGCRTGLAGEMRLVLPRGPLGC